MTNHYNVAIATPGAMFHAAYVQSLVATIKELERLGITYRFLNRYSSFVPTARELTAIDAGVHDYSHNKIAGGRFTCDKIFWIDSDVEWEPEDFLKLYNSEHDIISGVYALDHTGLIAANKLDENGIPKRMLSIEVWLEEEPFVVGGVGFGFVCIKSSVWESIPRPWFSIGKLNLENEDGTTIKVNVGEDYSWCGRAQQSGYEVKLDPLVKVGHHKESVLRV